MKIVDSDFDLVRQLLAKHAWPGVDEGLSWGTPGLKVRKKMLVRLREPGVLVVPCEWEEKEFLLSAFPDVYYQTDHYKGWAGVLVRLDVIDPDELAFRIEKAWRAMATKQMIDEFERR